MRSVSTKNDYLPEMTGTINKQMFSLIMKIVILSMKYPIEHIKNTIVEKKSLTHERKIQIFLM
jgi:hypothetical protein